VRIRSLIQLRDVSLLFFSDVVMTSEADYKQVIIVIDSFRRQTHFPKATNLGSSAQMVLLAWFGWSSLSMSYEGC